MLTPQKLPDPSAPFRRVLEADPELLTFAEDHPGAQPAAEAPTQSVPREEDLCQSPRAPIGFRTGASASRKTHNTDQFGGPFATSLRMLRKKLCLMMARKQPVRLWYGERLQMGGRFHWLAFHPPDLAA